MADPEVPRRPKRLGKSVPKSNNSPGGLLMTVIRTLTMSQNVAERDRERIRLEHEFKQSNDKLETLVAAHSNELSQVLHTFRRIPTRIAETRRRLRDVRQRLGNCRGLLLCKRDEVRGLWRDVMEHKHTLQLLAEVETLLTTPDRVQAYLASHHYLHATQLFVSVSSTLNGPMKSIEALKEVKREIFSKNDEIFEHLIKDLNTQLYEVSTLKFLKKLRAQNVEDAFELNQKHLPNMANFLQEDILANPREDTRHFITLMVSCLFQLKRLPDAIQAIKEQCQMELMAIVWRTPAVLSETLPNLRLKRRSGEQDESYMLRAFLDLVFQQFRVVLALHQWILLVLVYLGKDHPVPPYDLGEIWSKAQTVLQLLATEYLDISASPRQAPASLSDIGANINHYFSKKKPIKPKQVSLFKFDGSSHALSMNAYINEQREALIKRGELWNFSDGSHHQYVCEPACRNVVVIFNPTMKFIHELESSLSLQLGDQSPLRNFLMDYVKEFIPQLTIQVDSMVERAIKDMEDSNFSSNASIQREEGNPRPILQSTVLVQQSIQELEVLLSSLPCYATHFHGLICKILGNYKEVCTDAFRSIVQHESQDKRIISATWAKDEDISRYLKSLPTWIALQNQKGHTGSTEIEETPEEVNLRNKKVSEILTSNITGDTLIPQHEILSDIGKLRLLGQLHESLEWLGGRVVTLSCSLPCQDHKPSILPPSKFKDIPPFSKAELDALCEVGRELDGLGDTCLLVLYLEARVHCFYHLLPLTSRISYCIALDTQEPDNEVMRLIKDLAAIEEELSHTLLPRKLRCIFEGLGHLLASIFINYVGKLNKINENGVKRICRNIHALQQSQTSITKTREVALDRARQYYELLYQTSEEVLNSILDYGPQFQEMEYTNILKLIHHSNPNFDQYSLDQDLRRLLEILSKVSVQL
ncbi:EXOC4 [Cordylochernes scorpioides]|uniref:Exocyst complex component Sec8 n=1 Tax=Cordylochernes scorpioides TaxID=51811 RepID=A0ABY6KVI5_9ARAC|nr:EXOC4 [Cordylochernes scorpioides]